MTYTINEGPAPLRNNSDNNRIITFIPNNKTVDIVSAESETLITNRLVDMRKYTIQPRQPQANLPNTVNTTIVNNIVQVSGSGGTLIKAKYIHVGTQGPFTMKTKLINNGNGIGTFDENDIPIWNTTTNELVNSVVGEVIEIQIRFQTETDTLGGSFEIEIDKRGSNPILDIQEYTQTNQFQDYTIIFKVICDADFVSNNACINIKPELGMNLSISNLSFLILK